MTDWFTRFHETGPLARLVSGVLLTVMSVLIVVGAVLAAQLTRPSAESEAMFLSAVTNQN